MGRRVEHAWRLRWGALMACAAARAVASSMLELPGARGSGCDTLPPQDVSGSGVSLVWLGEFGVLWHWCAVRCPPYFTASV